MGGKACQRQIEPDPAAMAAWYGARHVNILGTGDLGGMRRDDRILTDFSDVSGLFR